VLIVGCITGNHKSNINAAEFSTISCLKPMFVSVFMIELTNFWHSKKNSSARWYPFKKTVHLLSWWSYVL